jgi:energy-coupling factor transporter ATP-binding protein EcfA2
MNLISLRIDKYRVLRNIEVVFDSISVRDAPNPHQGYALDFLAGVNGTGKTTVLQVLAKLLSTLQTESYNFPIPVELTYSIKNQTGEEQIIKISNIDPNDEEHPLENLIHTIGEEEPRSEKMRPESLPNQVVVYTTGSESAWRKELGLEMEFIPEAQIGAYNTEMEDERYLKELPGHYAPEIPEDNESEFDPEQTILFIYENRFPLVTLCGLVASIKDKHDTGKDNQVLQPVLDAIEIDDLRSFSLRIRKHQNLTPASQWKIIEQLEKIADQIVQSGADRLLIFNLDQQLANYVESKSTSIFGIYDTPIDLFKNLNLLYERRRFYEAPLQEVNVFLRKCASESEKPSNGEAPGEPATMLHLLDWLSDGERSFLGRMAMFALFRADNLLIILDEPEVHFNDVWKREIVHMLDQIMEGCASHAIISTHSSIALSDVRQEDILVFRRFGQFVEGEDAVRQPGIRTLGADPSDIMVHVFGTKFASGTHSVSYIRDKIAKATSQEDLKKLQDSIAPGYWYYRVQLEMEQYGEQVLQ